MHPAFEPGGASYPAVASVEAVNPDNPRWGLLAGLLTWLGSVALLLFVPLLFLIPYALIQRTKLGAQGQNLLEDKTALFLTVLSVFAVHIITFALVWAVVTRFGKLPFWSALGWSWSQRVGFWTSAGLAILLLVAGLAFTSIFHGEPTDIDKLIQSSAASRFTLAILAATTGPFVEELVYRGVLYPVLNRVTGMFWAILLVAILFTLPHIPQYYNNVSVIIVVFVLGISLTAVRAFTGKLLPCFVMHIIFNGIQSIMIVAAHFSPQAVPEIEQKTTSMIMLARSVLHLL